MKRCFIHKIIASLLLSSSALLAMDPPVVDQDNAPGISKTFSNGLKEINPYLYIGQEESGLYFVMERIDHAIPHSAVRLDFWKDYAYQERENHNAYREKWARGAIPPHKGFLMFKGKESSLISGLTSFDKSLKYNSNSELWMAFTSTKPITTAEQIRFDDIEMVMPVMTATPDMTGKGAPMISFMGISRSFHYLLRAIDAENRRDAITRCTPEVPKLLEEDEFKVHPGLAMRLQSMAAKVMKLRNPNLLYMINSPVETVRNITVKTFPGHVYVGDNVEIAKDMHQKMTDSGTPFQSKHIAYKRKNLAKQISLYSTSAENINDFLWFHSEDSHSENELRALWAKLEDMTIREIKSCVKEMREEGVVLIDQYDIAKAQEIDQLSQTIEITPQMSPIRMIGNKVQILDQQRQKVVFEHDKDLNIIFVNGQELKGDETKRYDWYYHPDRGLNLNVTVDLQPLADYLKLSEDK